MNLANHSYWCLGPGDLSGHRLQIAADRYTPVDADLIPTGATPDVAGTPFDFRRPRTVGPEADTTYDHNFCLADGRRPLAFAARLTGPTGLALTLDTTEPGLQVYDAARMSTGTCRGHSGAPLGAFAGVALEAQCWPDAPHHPTFPPIRLDPGQTLRQETRWSFSADPAPDHPAVSRTCRIHRPPPKSKPERKAEGVARGPACRRRRRRRVTRRRARGSPGSASGRRPVPGPDRRPLLRLDEGHVGRRHRMGQAGLQVDSPRLAPRSRPRSPAARLSAPRGCPRQTGSAAWHIEQRPCTISCTCVEALGRGEPLPPPGVIARASARLVVAQRRQPGDHHEQDRRRRPGPVRIALARVMGVEPVPDRHAHQEHQARDQPVVSGWRRPAGSGSTASGR